LGEARFKEYDKEDFLKDTETEFKRAGKEILYWFPGEAGKYKKSYPKESSESFNKLRGILICRKFSQRLLITTVMNLHKDVSSHWMG